MTVAPASRLGPYEITAKLGAGGMGEVWRARDTKLEREVAIKVLPEAFVDDAGRLARFEREAKVLASLNHPHIASIFGLEESDGVRALVMELVEGEGLDERIARGPIPVDEAIPIALQIAEALEAAHERGIVHRDLKPANVKVTADGTVKVLDFGLAKAWVEEVEGGGLSLSPTITSHHTHAGVILGTAAYMAPEQARGRPVDRRADIWAFGVVLWEMLTGEKLFGGETVSDVLAAVLTREIPVGALPGATPGWLARLLGRCLERDPLRRLQWVGDARLELAEPQVADEILPPPTARNRSALALLPWLLVVLAGSIATWMVTRPRVVPARPSLIEASIVPPTGQSLDFEAGLALSPAGDELAFVARDEHGASNLWVRPLARSAATALPETTGAEAPFWSPDGRFIGYFQDGKIYTLELATGNREAITEVRATHGASWGTDGTVIYSPDWGAPMMKVRASGGAPEPIELPMGLDEVFAWPCFLPDGRHFLYLARNYASDAPMGELRVGSLDGGESTFVVASNSGAQLALPDLVVWWHGGNLRAQPFDLERLELEDRPIVISSGVRFQADSGLAAFSVARHGALVFGPGGVVAGNQLVIVDRDGTVERKVGDPGIYYEPRLSPDGREVAVDRSDEANRGDIWMVDVERGTGTRLTSFPEDDTEPVWSPDGDAVVFCSNHNGSEPAVFIQRPSSNSVAVPLVREKGINLRPRSWSRNGDLLVYRKAGGKGELWWYSMTDESFRPYISAPSTAESGDFSPDGRFVTYVSSDTGRPEVYVATFPDPSNRWRVSVDGGTMPMWSPRGDEIFFESLGNTLMVADVDAPDAGTGTAGGEGLEFSVARPLFGVQIRRSPYNRNYDTVDGRRFLLNATVRPDNAAPLSLVLNWDRRLERR